MRCNSSINLCWFSSHLSWSTDRQNVCLTLLRYCNLFFYIKLHKMYKGHSIEAGWFLLRYAVQNNMAELKQTAIDKFIVNPFQYGWDKEHGGLFYFLDVDGHRLSIITMYIFLCYITLQMVRQTFLFRLSVVFR